MRQVYITHSGSFLPNQAIGNDQMEAILGQSGPRPSRARRVILRSNGITSRHYAIDPDSGQATHTNAQLAANAITAMADDEFGTAHIDTLACGTSIADQLVPGHAVMVHGDLGNPPCEVYSAAGVCVAGMTALKYAYYAVACGESDCAVSSGSERPSAILRGEQFAPELSQSAEALAKQPELAFNKDFLRWMLSDGAGALALKPQPRSDGLSLRIDWLFQRSYANEFEACMYAGAEKQADGNLRGWLDLSPQDAADISVMSIKQDVKLLNAKIVEATVSRPLRELIANKKLRAEEIGFFLPHYSSGYFREPISEALREIDFAIPYERWFTNLSTRGNTGAASIYIMIDELLRSNTLKPGQKLLCYVPESGRFSTAFAHLTVCDAASP